MGWNYLSIPKLQWLYRWSLGMGKWSHPTLEWTCDYSSMLRLKLNHVSKMGPRGHVATSCVYVICYILHTASPSVSTLLEIKVVTPPFEALKSISDRIFVFPVGWNWHEMYLWVFPIKIRPYYFSWSSLTPGPYHRLFNHVLSLGFGNQASLSTPQLPRESCMSEQALSPYWLCN